jgi:hypothetical protein
MAAGGSEAGAAGGRRAGKRVARVDDRRLDPSQAARERSRNMRCSPKGRDQPIALQAQSAMHTGTASEGSTLPLRAIATEEEAIANRHSQYQHVVTNAGL